MHAVRRPKIWLLFRPDENLVSIYIGEEELTQESWDVGVLERLRDVVREAAQRLRAHLETKQQRCACTCAAEGRCGG